MIGDYNPKYLDLRGEGELDDFLEEAYSKHPENELLARRVVRELEGVAGEKHLDEYADPRTERGQCMLKTICEKLGFHSLGYQSVEGVLESIGIDRKKVCTYCWTGKE